MAQLVHHEQSQDQRRQKAYLVSLTPFSPPSSSSPSSFLRSIPSSVSPVYDRSLSIHGIREATPSSSSLPLLWLLMYFPVSRRERLSASRHALQPDRGPALFITKDIMVWEEDTAYEDGNREGGRKIGRLRGSGTDRVCVAERHKRPIHRSRHP